MDRRRPRQPDVRSTTHRFGCTVSPGPAGRRTTNRTTRANHTAQNSHARQAESAYTRLIRGAASLARSMASRPPSQSCTEAGVTSSPHTSPRVSTTTGRLRPDTVSPPSKPRGPPRSVVFTDWRSRMPVAGRRVLPAARRTFSRRVAWMAARVPSLCQRRKSWKPMRSVGRSVGSDRHAPPVRATDRMPSTMSRRSYLAGRPPGRGGGTSRAMFAHGASVILDGSGVLLMPARVARYPLIGHPLRE